MQLLDAIVLQTYDVGDADRFCVLLTEQRGRLAARAYGVRKLTSRKGGALQPTRAVQVMLHDGSRGMQIREAVARGETVRTLQGFLRAQEGLEMLLLTLEDDHPVPEIFGLTEEFLAACDAEGDPVLPFTVRLLAMLGVMPEDPRHGLFAHLSEKDRDLIGRSMREPIAAVHAPDARGLIALCRRLLEQQTTRPLKAAKIRQAVE